jgi:hypothetical protein
MANNKKAPVSARAKGKEASNFHPHYTRKLAQLQGPTYHPDALFWCDACQVQAAAFERLGEYWRYVAILEEAGVR